MDIDFLSANFELIDDIWHAKSANTVSYPSDGNDMFFQIEDLSYWFKHRNNCIIELIKMFHFKQLFYDIGGGNGFVSMGLQNAGIESVLIEPGLQGVKHAKSRGVKNIVCASLEEMCLEKGVIPSAGIFDVLEHIEDDLSFLKNIYSYLKDQGKFIITVPAYNFLWSKEDIDAGHYRRYTLNDLSRKVESAGFKINYATYLFSVLPAPIYFLRSLPYKLKIKKHTHNLKKYTNEHSSSGVLNFVFEKTFEKELEIIKKFRKINFGSSCLIIAEKQSNGTNF